MTGKSFVMPPKLRSRSERRSSGWPHLTFPIRMHSGITSGTLTSERNLAKPRSLGFLNFLHGINQLLPDNLRAGNRALLSHQRVMSSIEADFDRLAVLDEEGWTANNHYHDSLLKYIPQNCENALEIGCGTGAFARELARRSKRVVALDMSAEMVRVARKRSEGIGNLEFQVADVRRWEFPQERRISQEHNLKEPEFQKEHFDFVCSIATFHHLEQRELLLKIRDALRPGGVLVVLDLVESSGLRERMMDVVGFGVSVGLRLLNNGRLQPPPEVRKAWEQHGKHDHYSTISQVRTLADEILPGAVVKRCLLWRYLLVYQKPATD